MDPGLNPVTPEEIIDLILEEMRAEMAPSYYSVLVRSVYDVYLHIHELERLRPALDHIRGEAIRALNDELVKLNKTKKLKFPFLEAAPAKPKRYQTLGDWIIEFHENTDDDAGENPLIIHSAFALPTASDDRAGTLTERVTKRNPEGRTSTMSRPITVETRLPDAVVFGTLEYEDQTGTNTFEITKNQIKIGRGGEHAWVDLKLHAPLDVSREHAQLRRDPATGRFYLKDLSRLGTTLNGETVPPSIESTNGNIVDKNIEVAMPGKARIGLAGVLFLKFKEVKRK
jgi:hypothetical protein